ncbi:DUF4097 family beta strand repeat-containing protein [Treponema phagedenis]|uniref:DUF4097 family beta strand repeat-containing protein n=1 Tax=Treponema phagedenis TaxID=162 RepID=UPI0001F63EB9|nr:DUF4097 family beta strand repeat-containing protein [Treponema phagedenis]EFW37744.1 hypothetical protein HMPREF9554_01747 [Treponema phagedenis F0421]TYT79404.1 DUF4097 domain-containing protein [Treponema phagedenis]
MKNNCKHRVIVFILGIFAVSLCLGACFHKCNAKLTIDWGNHSRVMINEEWEHYRITKEYDTEAISSLEFTHERSPAIILKTGTAKKIIIHTVGLPDEVMSFDLVNKKLIIIEKDTWSRKAREMVSIKNNDWYTKSKIEIEIPEGFRFNDMRIISNAPLKLQKIESDNLYIDAQSGDIELVKCNFTNPLLQASNGNIAIDSCAIKRNLTLSTKNGNITIDNTETENDILLNSKNGNTDMNNFKAANLKIETKNSFFNGEASSFDTITCNTHNGNFNFEGTVKKEITVTTDVGNISIQLLGGNTLSKAQFKSTNGNLMMKNISAIEAKAESDTGFIIAEKVSFNSLACETDTGSVDFKGSIKKEADIQTKFGNINLELEKPLDDYAIFTDSDNPLIKINHNSPKNQKGKNKQIISGSPDAARKIFLSTKSGMITINEK